MAASQISLYQLKLGRCTRTVVTSLLRFWESRNMMKTGELMGVDMLLLDDQVRMKKEITDWRRVYRWKKETSELRKEVDLTQFLLEDIMRMV